MQRREFLKATGIGIGSLALSGGALPGRLWAQNDSAVIDRERKLIGSRPNIVWIMIEDWGRELSCYGEKGVHTPHMDKIAADGILYDNGFCTSPVCSPSRSAMMTGFYENSIGSADHRCKGGKLPEGVFTVPELLGKAGYFTCLMGVGKLDLNFDYRRGHLFHGKDWGERKQDQPFFAQITITGTHRVWRRDPERPIDGKDIVLPPFYPDTPDARRDWANGLEEAQRTDREVGEFIARLEKEGLAENTLVFLVGDNGRCHFRDKQYIYDGGLRVAMMAKWPGRIKPGTRSRENVTLIDISATILDVAGARPDGYKTHGQYLFDDAIPARKYIFASRGRMGDQVDHSRAIRRGNVKLIHNLMPERPYLQHTLYRENSYPMYTEMSLLHLDGKLNAAQELFFRKTKPEFELFDIEKDPHELNNLAGDRVYGEKFDELKNELNRFRAEIGDNPEIEKYRSYKWPEFDYKISVQEWMLKHPDIDYSTFGYPPYSPTRPREQWEEMAKLWKEWLYRDPRSKMKQPVRVYTQKFGKVGKPSGKKKK